MGSEVTRTYRTLRECTSTGSVSYGIVQPGKHVENGVPIIRVNNINDGTLDIADPLRVDSAIDEKHRKTRLEGGEVLLSLVGTTGQCVVAGAELKGWNVARAIAVIRPADGINAEWVTICLKSPETQHYLDSRANTTVQKTLNLQDVREIPILTVPDQEERYILEWWNTLNDKIELNRRMNATLEGMAQALFKSWFVDFDPVIDNALTAGNPIPDELAPRAEVRRRALANGTTQQSSIDHPTLPDPKSLFPDAFEITEELGWIPEGWEVTNFGSVSSCFDRKRIPLSKKQREVKKPGTIPYYGATSIMDFIDEWIFDDTYLLIGEDGSVVKEDGSPFVQYIWGQAWVNNHAHVLQGKEGVTTEHLMLFMQSQNISAYVTGAVQLKINQGNMNRVPFLKAGDLVNQRFAECITPFYERVMLLTEKSKTLTKLRDTLIPNLISGELRLPEADQLIDEAIV